MDAATRTPTRPDWPTRTFAPLYHRLLDRIDRGLAEGAIEAYLPDGTRRLLGGHAAGPLAVVRVVRWRALRCFARMVRCVHAAALALRARAWWR